MAIIPNPVQRENSIEETLGDRRTDHGSGKETAQQQSWRNPSLSVSRFTERLIVSGTVGGRRGIWIQFVQPVNKWFGGRTAGTCGVTGRMIPCQRCNSRFRKELANRRHQGIKRQLRTKPKVQHSLRLSDGGGSVLTKAQQASKTLRRRSSGTFSVSNPDVHKADTTSTNWRSGIPGCWIFRDCIVVILDAAAKASQFCKTLRTAPLHTV